MQVAAAVASTRGTEAGGAKPSARRLVRVMAGRRRWAALLLLALAYTAAMLMLAMGGGEVLGTGAVVEAALQRRAAPATTSLSPPSSSNARFWRAGKRGKGSTGITIGEGEKSRNTQGDGVPIRLGQYLRQFWGAVGELFFPFFSSLIKVLGVI
uniref:Uncharacterized protein n=1 Tax=Setaria viridis TaxID=4556 RepID=A0A4U6U779_SETVI|nr:hypothetical protein SEVIR_6G201300v2 [Setaria viridis]